MPYTLAYINLARVVVSLLSKESHVLGVSKAFNDVKLL